MSKGEITGSWFNSGFHGHYRSKSRNDFICEYRHLAKPQPPKSFVRKLRLPASTHQFSKHDNKEIFMNDALIFTEGLGKRRFTNPNLGWNPELLTWRHRPGKGPPQDTKHSAYTVTFRGDPHQKPLTQKIIQRPKTSFDEGLAATTTYRYAHGRDNPNRDTLVLNAMSNEGLASTSQHLATTASRTIRPKKFAFSSGRESVATCLNWSWAAPPKSTHIGMVESGGPKGNCGGCNENGNNGFVPTPPTEPKPSGSNARCSESTESRPSPPRMASPPPPPPQMSSESCVE